MYNIKVILWVSWYFTGPVARRQFCFSFLSYFFLYNYLSPASKRGHYVMMLSICLSVGSSVASAA